MFVRYRCLFFEGESWVRKTCISKVDNLSAKKIPDDDNDSWGIYLPDNKVPIAVFDREYAGKALEQFQKAIIDGDHFFNLEVLENRFAFLEKQKAKKEDKPC